MALSRGSSLRIATVARQEPGKNTDQLIRALQLVRHHLPQVRIEVVGDGTLLPALRELAIELGLECAVTFHGRLPPDAVLEVLLDCELFCLPSSSEGFPKAVHEAMACGLPVVTTGVSVLNELVGRKNGVILADTEPETVATALLDLLSDRQRRAELATSAMTTAAHYQLERWRDEIGRHLEAAWDRPLREQDQ
jgi:glycosyltransferase involved in cell wall biosynthesis